MNGKWGFEWGCIIGLTVATLFITIIIVMTGSDSDEANSPAKTVDTKKARTYEVIDIDGMPCIKWSSGGSVGGLTCNWDKWKGEAQ